MKVLVLGATGDQGRPQVHAALQAGHAVVAGVRDPAKASLLFGPRVPCAAIDFGNSAMLRTAMQGADAVLANFPSSSFNDGEWLIGAASAVGEAARDSGVRHIVFNTSLPQRDHLLGYRAHDVRFLMRERLAVAGVPLTVLCPVVFMGNLLRGWAFPHIADEGRFVYPHGPALEVSWICQEDLASLMLAAAERPALAGRVLMVGGPQALRGAEVAAILSEASGRTITFVSQSVADFCGAMRAQLKSTTEAERERMLSELERIYRWYNESSEKPFKVDMQPVLQLLPVRLTPLREWARSQHWTRGA